MYTTDGLLSAVSNANGHGVAYGYDAHGRLSQVAPQAGPTVRYGNDALGFTTNIALPGLAGDRLTAIERNALGWVRKITHPDNVSEAFSHDAIGNMTTHTDCAGRATVYTYLPTRKLASVSRSLGGAAVTTSFAYDNQFNTLRITDPMGRPVETYALDGLDRPVSVTNLEGQSMSVAYGVAGWVKQVTRFDGTTVSNAYDTAGRLAAVTYPGLTNRFSYLKNGLLAGATNATCRTTLAYDGANRLTQATVTGLVSKGITLTYSADPVGNVTNVGCGLGFTNSASFDAAERIASLSAIGGTAGTLRFNWGYDTNNGLAAGVSALQGHT